tara:strand:- start:1913 stop:2068 length:156 start_codon:yes stop_codon:yes gene_type:complete
MWPNKLISLIDFESFSDFSDFDFEDQNFSKNRHLKNFTNLIKIVQKYEDKN